MASPNDAVKQKQKFFLYGIVGLIVTIAFLVVYVKKNSKPVNTGFERTTSPEVIEERYAGVKSAIDEREIWMAESSNRIDELERENSKLKNQLQSSIDVVKKQIKSEIKNELDSSRDEIKAELEQQKLLIEQKFNNIKPVVETNVIETNSVSDNQNVSSNVANKPFSSTDSGSPFAPKGTTTKPPVITHKYYDDGGRSIADYTGDDLVKEPEFTSISFNKNNVTQPTNITEKSVTGVGEKPDPSISGIQDNASGFSVENQMQGNVQANQPELKKADSYIPAGSFVRAILLGGLDAPTGGQSQQNPHPVLLKVEDLAQLPNNYQYDLVDCMAIGAAHGDISSERAMIRMETLSCIDKQNNVHEAPIRGFVFGEDGKAGTRGRVITKQGQILMNSLIAGIGAGIGDAFQQQAYSIQETGLGTVTSIQPDKLGWAGAGEGVSRALDRLSEYYISLAEKMFPVIEVDAGRAVDIVLTSGFELKGVRKQQTIEQADYTEELNQLSEVGKRVVSQVQNVTGVRQ